MLLKGLNPSAQLTWLCLFFFPPLCTKEGVSWGRNLLFLCVEVKSFDILHSVLARSNLNLNHVVEAFPPLPFPFGLGIGHG